MLQQNLSGLIRHFSSMFFIVFFKDCFVCFVLCFCRCFVSFCFSFFLFFLVVFFLGGGGWGPCSPKFTLPVYVVSTNFVLFIRINIHIYNNHVCDNYTMDEETRRVSNRNFKDLTHTCLKVLGYALFVVSVNNNNDNNRLFIL